MAIDHCGAKGMASGKLQLNEMLDETQHPPISRVYLDGKDQSGGDSADDFSHQIYQQNHEFVVVTSKFCCLHLHFVTGWLVDVSCCCFFVLNDANTLFVRLLHLRMITQLFLLLKQHGLLIRLRLVHCPSILVCWLNAFFVVLLNQYLCGQSWPCILMMLNVHM